MKKEVFHFNLGSYFTTLQRTVKVDDHRLTNAEICKRARISTATFAKVKKGFVRSSTPTMLWLAFTCRHCWIVVTTAFAGSWRRCTAVWRPIRNWGCWCCPERMGIAKLLPPVLLNEWGCQDAGCHAGRMWRSCLYLSKALHNVRVDAIGCLSVICSPPWRVVTVLGDFLLRACAG